MGDVKMKDNKVTGNDVANKDTNVVKSADDTDKGEVTPTGKKDDKQVAKSSVELGTKEKDNKEAANGENTRGQEKSGPKIDSPKGETKVETPKGETNVTNEKSQGEANDPSDNNSSDNVQNRFSQLKHGPTDREFSSPHLNVDFSQ